MKIRGSGLNYNSNNVRSLKKRGGNCLLCLNGSYAPAFLGTRTAGLECMKRIMPFP